MSTPAFRRFANPLSIWIAMLAVVLQSVMPMVAQARMYRPATTATAHAAQPGGDAMPVDHAMSMDHAIPMDHAMSVPAPEAVAIHRTASASGPDGSLGVNASGHLDRPDVQAFDHSPVPSPANPHAMHGEACPYCRVHLDAVSLPPLPNPHWVLLITVVHRPIADDAVPVLPDAWSPTHPRGPPLIA